ncbi:MAG TPA: LuxR C-terminal-related transcriptional regulator [Polyangia bacterium]|nr:LuxR C-terminal-related transcriptional regulator [Polyangia bacterium]
MRQVRRKPSTFAPDKLGAFFEAAYNVDINDDEWVAETSRAARLVWGRGGPLHAALYDAADPAAFRTWAMHTIDMTDTAVAALRQAPSRMPAEFVLRSVRTGLVHRSGRALAPKTLKEEFQRMAQIGAPDCLTINGLDPEGKGAMVSFWITDGSRPGSKESAIYRRMAQHLAAANRCRRRLREARASATDGAEAVLDARLRIVHAEGDARDETARIELVAAATAREQTKRSRTDALERWHALTRTRWTLVDSFERDGKRYVVARENQARIQGLGQLTSRERQIVAHFALGLTVKETAYALGIAYSTVRVLLRRAAHKLGVASREALLAHPDVVRVRGQKTGSCER